MQKHLLIIDDEQSIRDVLTQYLTASGYRVSVVASALEAVDQVRKDPPDLIISDLQLEDADGLEMIAQIKTQHADIPVILLTGVLFDPEVVRDILRAKVTRYIEKTASLSTVVAAIKEILGPQA
jgi:two-component system, OmpR family, response regulator